MAHGNSSGIPPKIIHSEKRPGCYLAMIDDCARNIHLRKQATALLKFYAGHLDGFRPALALIEKGTGIPAVKISPVRQILVNHGLIAYNREKRYIYIAWNRIRAFAILEEPLRITRGKCTFFPVEPLSVHIAQDRTIGKIGRKYRINTPRDLTDEEKERFSILDSMTEREYWYIVEAIREAGFPHMPRPPDTS